MYGAFSKVSHGKAVKEAAKYWNSKMNALLPDMPGRSFIRLCPLIPDMNFFPAIHDIHQQTYSFSESRREKPIRTDFLNEAEFEEKLDKYSKVI